MATLHLILMGPRQDRWTWRATDGGGKQIAEAEHAFNCYLEVLHDARKHGFAEKHEFESIPVYRERL